ncbi:AbrB/MazE/SpoVT family DNA-binding domain-containing protein [Aminobacter aganoensis]|uniref:AbrB family looped-hinge helix DNA binding protein n=1 Tax=Aminobacter aganoensis TaxID=83264 RepID=A0A7X0FAZ7_9HYPH|nr:AbrB/MazE/SpoVT family DNA-binding domain-containing protein [Aminobacter aganoensis]MBB6356379.1 AbrB family looped-hinge helix DNA binding protein [Aminobacter aganoensis]
MQTLTVTSKGQITVRKEVLKHLGVRPGDKILLDLAPDGNVVLKAAPQKRHGIEVIFGILHDPNQAPLTIEEMNRVIADGWAGKR